MSEQPLPMEVDSAETVSPLSIKSVIVVGALLVLVGIAFIGYREYQKNALWAIPSRSSIANKPELAAAYDRTVILIKKIRSGEVDAKLPMFYIDAAQDLKIIGDTTRNNSWFEASLRIFERGIDATNRNNTLLIGNAAKMSVAAGDLNRAESYLREGIGIAPGETSLYIDLVNVLVKKGAPESEIIRVFSEGERRIVGGAELILRRSMYYISVAKFDLAQQDIELLRRAGILTNDSYAAAVADIASARAAAQK